MSRTVPALFAAGSTSYLQRKLTGLAYCSAIRCVTRIRLIFVPPPWTLGLRCLDAEHTELDIQEALTRATGTLVFSDAVQEFVGILWEQGFLETEEFHRLRDRKQAEFQESRERSPVHAGQAYPASASEVRSTFKAYFDTVTEPDGFSSSVLGVEAPDGSPPTPASSIGHASATGRPSSPAAAASWSATTCQFSPAAPAAATGSPDCKRSRSATAAPRS